MNKKTTNKGVIICVDDEGIVLSSLKSEILSYINYEYSIEIAESGEEAIELIDEFLSDGYDIPVVICDYIMPGMKGDILLRQIHKRSPQTFKILLTGQAAMEGVTNAINYAELYKYFDKPWDGKELREAVTSAIKLYYDQKHQIEEYNTLLEQEKYLNEKIKNIELALSSNQDKALENLVNIRKDLSTLRGVYESIVDLKKMVDLSQHTGSEEKEFDSIANSIQHLKQMLKNIDADPYKNSR